MLEQISADEKLKQEYYAREKAKLDATSRMKYAEIKGMEKGMEKGRHERNIEIAKNLLRGGMEIDLVSKFTELSTEEIEKIKAGETESKNKR